MRAASGRKGVTLMITAVLGLLAGPATADAPSASAAIDESMALEVAHTLKAAAEAPIVRTDHGLLRGERNQGFSVYRGIPFAAPPVGENRWRPPQPVTAWQGVREATRFGRDCMQKPLSSSASPGDERPDEDCLYLNVWQPDGARAEAGERDGTERTTAEPNDSGRPVVVWLYGGAYVNGGASSRAYDGASFARDGVLYVSSLLT